MDGRRSSLSSTPCVLQQPTKLFFVSSLAREETREKKLELKCSLWSTLAKSRWKRLEFSSCTIKNGWETEKKAKTFRIWQTVKCDWKQIRDKSRWLKCVQLKSRCSKIFREVFLEAEGTKYIDIVYLLQVKKRACAEKCKSWWNGQIAIGQFNFNRGENKRRTGRLISATAQLSLFQTHTHA